MSSRKLRFPLNASRQMKLAALLSPWAAFAAENQPSPPSALSAGTLLQTFLGLAVILALFVGAAWLMRRMNGGRGLIGSNGPLKLVGGIAIGTRERIVVLEVGDTWVVVGIAPGQMRTLHTLPKGDLSVGTADGNGQHRQFGQWLKQFKERRNETPD